jgi:hypothetical protein
VFGTFGAFHWLALSSLATLLVGYTAVFLRWPRGGWLDVHYYGICWSYVGLLSATSTEILVRVVHWSLTATVLVPTITVAVIGGGLTFGLKARAIARFKGKYRRPGGVHSSEP